jgi:hypothetical protein
MHYVGRTKNFRPLNVILDEITTMFESVNIITDRFISKHHFVCAFITAIGVIFPSTSDTNPSWSKRQNMDSLIFYSGRINFDSQQKY